jgi:PRTRC genetic system protein C
MLAGQRVVLPDPDPGLAPDDVRKMYAPMHPAILNASVVYPDSGADYEFLPKGQNAAVDSSPAVASGKASSYEFKPSIGKKG